MIRINLNIILFIIIIATTLMSQNLEDNPQNEKILLRCGYLAYDLSDIYYEDAMVALQLWTNQILDELDMNIKAEVNVFQSLPLLLESFEKNELDFVTLSSLTYIRIKDQLPLVPTVVITHGEEPGEDYILVVRKDSHIKDLVELKDKDIIVSKYYIDDSITHLWLETLLLENNLPQSKDFFAHIKVEEKASKVILPVFFKQSDACIIPRRTFEIMSELNPQIKNELIIIKKSPFYTLALMCLRKNFDQELSKRIFNELVNFHTNPKGKQILTLFKYDKLIPFKSNYLDEIIALKHKYEKLKVVSQE